MFLPFRWEVTKVRQCWIGSNDGNLLAAKECRVLYEFFVAVRTRSFDDVHFLLERKLRHFLIGSNNGSSLVVR
ncbi:hypothetical protein KFK09_025476 [Dendrobium nobile]|uniref:Uncharacterized protein n=1 Tax=Dendrobium nobile TaxID=94219 RepID=A0A8T3AFI0_DENNO|nr:hypothetical protein KFK09_025476 [Dendrobium nobile]